MKVNSINSYNRNLISNPTLKTGVAKKPCFGLVSNPILPPLGHDQVSFTASPSTFFLKVFDDLHCPCCGIEMSNTERLATKLDKSLVALTSSQGVHILSENEGLMNKAEKACLNDLRTLSEKHPNLYPQEMHSTHLQKILAAFKIPELDFLNKLDEKFLSKRGSQAIKPLSELENYMHPTEKAAFQLVKEHSKNNQNKTLKELFESIRNTHLEKLKKTELGVLNKIILAGRLLSESSAQKLALITDRARKEIVNDGLNDTFKRKNILGEIFTLKNQIPEKDVAGEICKIAHSFPSSGEDVNAFVVKYSGRSSKEIARRLVSSSLGTFEHIQPKSLGGANGGYNGLLECAADNNSRGHQSFSDFLKDKPRMMHNIPEGTDIGEHSIESWTKEHPEHKGFVQKHMDEVIEKINKGVIKGHDHYPAEVAITIAEQSGGSLLIDISAQKLKSERSKELVQLLKKYNIPCDNLKKKPFKNNTHNENSFDSMEPETTRRNKSRHSPDVEKDGVQQKLYPFGFYLSKSKKNKTKKA